MADMWIYLQVWSAICLQGRWVFINRGRAMAKFQAVYVQGFGWSVIIISNAAVERYYGFRDENHARDWIAENLEKKQLAATLGLPAA
jgi:hypothetical protein